MPTTVGIQVVLDEFPDFPAECDIDDDVDIDNGHGEGGKRGKLIMCVG